VEITLREYISPQNQSPSLLTVTLRCVTLPFADMIQRASLKVNNRRFKDRYFHIPLPIVTKHELFYYQMAAVRHLRFLKVRNTVNPE